MISETQCQSRGLDLQYECQQRNVYTHEQQRLCFLQMQLFYLVDVSKTELPHPEKCKR